MRYRKLDENGDYSFGGQQADYYRDTPLAVAQAVQTRLMLFRGEWFLDTTDGTPWMTEVLGKNTRATYDAAIRQRILGTPGVIELVSYSSDLDTDARQVAIAATINTVYGQTTVQARI